MLIPDPIFTFFGLRENPFSINPDPRFLVLHPAAQAAWDDLLYGVSNRKGLILLTGELGTGKTTLVRGLVDWLRSHKSPSTLVVNSYLNTADLLDIVLSNFGILCSSAQRTDKLEALHRWLLRRFDARQLPVLILDEAQGLLPRVLEEIRLLLNLETSSSKLLQIVLAGQPELDQKLRAPQFSAIRQRIAVRCHTSALRVDQTHQYVTERLRLAGGAPNSADIFPSETLDAIYHYSRGIPRLINLLCEHSLINGRAEQRRSVPPETVTEVAREFRCEPVRPGAPHRPEPLFPGDSILPPLNAPPPQHWMPPPGGLNNFPAGSVVFHTNSLPPAVGLPAASSELASLPKLSTRHKFSAAEILSSSLASAPPEVAPRPASPTIRRPPEPDLPRREQESTPDPISAEVSSHQGPAVTGQPLPWRRGLQVLKLRARVTLQRLAQQTAPHLFRVFAGFREGVSSIARARNRVFPFDAWLGSLQRDSRRFAADVRRWLQTPVNSAQRTPPRQRSERRVADRRVAASSQASRSAPATRSGTAHRSASS
jgi:general secretion pathway protein A